MIEQIVETWTIHNRINLYLLDALTEETLTATFAPRGRTVYALFVHIHNVRLMWFKSSAPEMLEGLEKLEKAEGEVKERLAGALTASGLAVETLLRDSLTTREGKIKGFKPHAVAFMGYLISHESHHRGQVEVALRLSGHALPDKISYGLWEWGVR